MKPIVALFDIDGVLIHCGGYRKAFQDSLQYFLRQMNLEHLTPGKNIPELYEAIGVTCEWDMLPITLLIIYDAIAQKFDSKIGIDPLEATINSISCRVYSGLTIDYEDGIQAISPYLDLNPIASISVLEYYLKDYPTGPFCHLKQRCLPFELLTGTRDINKSRTTRVFQNYSLGEDKFRAAYQVEPWINSPSYLERFDTPLINDDTLGWLVNGSKNNHIFSAGFTLRPSLPPKGVELSDIEQKDTVYSPEADIAFSTLKLDRIPLVGYGKLNYLARQFGLNPDQLIKPAPFHALTAIKAALSNEEWQSLVWAKNILFDSNHKGSFFEDGMPRLFDVHVFEDSFVGILSARKAVGILEALGYRIKFFAWGITKNEEKRKTLMEFGAIVFPDVNEAVKSIFFI